MSIYKMIRSNSQFLERRDSGQDSFKKSGKILRWGAGGGGGDPMTFGIYL